MLAGRFLLSSIIMFELKEPEIFQLEIERGGKQLLTTLAQPKFLKLKEEEKYAWKTQN